MNGLKKVTKIIVNIFTFVLLGLLILVIYGKVTVTFGGNKFPNYFGYTFFEVASGSMEPTLKVNDVIVVKILNDDLNKGDIVAFYSDNAIITHRIIFMEGNILTVKGDSNNVVDKPITREQVIGKVVKIVPELGIWKKVLTEPKILLGIFVTLLLFDFALSYDGKNKREKDLEEDNEDEKQEELVKPVVVEEKKVEKKIEPSSLLELTRKIDIDEINKLLENTEYKLEKKEINNIKREVNKIKESNTFQEVEPIFTEREKRALEYTMRLDLSEIQRKIRSKIK